MRDNKIYTGRVYYGSLSQPTHTTESEPVFRLDIDQTPLTDL